MAKRLGIMGGTFNPIHNGHMSIAGIVRRALALDEVRFMPTGDSPHKHVTMPAIHRLNMVKLAVQGREDFTVSDMEIRRAGRSYTCDTLREIRAREPESELFFILGGDMFCDMQRWRNPQTIAALAALVAVPRPGDDFEELSAMAERLKALYAARTIIIDDIGPEISSTEIRDRVAAGEDISSLVPASVARYIRENKLYLKLERGI